MCSLFFLYLCRVYRRQIQTLEAQLKLKQRNQNQNTPLPQEIAVASAENASLNAANATLKEENMDLKDEIQVLRATVEVLKARQQAPSSPRSSPIITASFNLNTWEKPVVLTLVHIQISRLCSIIYTRHVQVLYFYYAVAFMVIDGEFCCTFFTLALY